MTRPDRDPYDVLGVSRQASAREISRAYRRAARTSHPDSRPADPSAAERFRDLAAAYEILGDPDRRAVYDRADQGVRVVVTRRTAHGPPPVRLGPRRSAAGEADVGFGSMLFGAGPPRRSGRLDVDAGGSRFESPTHAEDELFQLAAELLRRLRSGWL